VYRRLSFIQKPKFRSSSGKDLTGRTITTMCLPDHPRLPDEAISLLDIRICFSHRVLFCVGTPRCAVKKAAARIQRARVCESAVLDRPRIETV
jgi:hypothetical protein